MNLHSRKILSRPLPSIERWGEAVTQADQTLYGLRTKALIITLQTWLMSSGPSHTPSDAHTQNTMPEKTPLNSHPNLLKKKLKSDGLSSAVCSTVHAWRSESLSASLKTFALSLFKQRDAPEAQSHAFFFFFFTAGPNLTLYCSFNIETQPRIVRQGTQTHYNQTR